jgi:uncharacterized protein YecT (DUF1311 family)
MCPVANAQSDDEELIREVAKREKIPFEEVRREYVEGCESGYADRMKRCTHYRAVAADIELNRTYKVLQSKLKRKEAKESLRGAQRAWLKFLEAHCNFAAIGYWPGADWEAVQNSCVLDETRLRTEKLKEYLACDSGGCPE